MVKIKNNLQVVSIIAKPVSQFFTVQSCELKNKNLWFVNRFFLLDSHFRCRFAETGHFHIWLQYSAKLCLFAITHSNNYIQ